jgi:FHS family glucose/mannose:H+ symporter-like MFS transporter
LSLINLSWGIGAVICPFLVVAALGISESFVILYGLAALLLLAIVILTRVPLPICLLTTKVGNSDRHPAAIWLNRYVPILGAVFFLYVGTEASVGGWIASYAQRSMPAGTTWLITPSYFWGSLLFGRLITPILLRQLKEVSLSSLGLLLAVFGVTAAITARNSIELDVSTCLAGLGLSAVFPIAIAILSLKFGSAASRVAGLMFNLAGFGGATLPWVVGVVSTRFGNLKFGLFVPLCGCLAMLFLNLLLQQGSPSSDESRA